MKIKSILKGASFFLATFAFVGLFSLVLKFVKPQNIHTPDITTQVVYADEIAQINSSSWSSYKSSNFSTLKTLTKIETYVNQTDTTGATSIGDNVYAKMIDEDGDSTLDTLVIFSTVEGKIFLPESCNAFFGSSSGSNYVFQSVTSLDLSNFDSSNVTDMYAMFRGLKQLTSINLSGLNTSKVTRMDELFFFCGRLTEIDISNFDTSKVENMSEMFACFYYSSSGSMSSTYYYERSYSSLTSIIFPENFGSAATNMSNMFQYCSNLETIDTAKFNTSNVENMSAMFSTCYLEYQFSNPNLWMRYGTSKLKNLDLSHFNTSKVTNMEGMFMGCGSLTSLDLSSFDTSKVENFQQMLVCASVYIPDANSSNAYASASFSSSLTSLDISSFDTSSATDMGGMFTGCNKLTSLDLSNFNTENLTSMNSMFLGCSSLKTLDISSFDLTGLTSSISSDEMPFTSCSSLQNIYLPTLLNEYSETITLPNGTWIADYDSEAGTTIGAFNQYSSNSYKRAVRLQDVGNLKDYFNWFIDYDHVFDAANKILTVTRYNGTDTNVVMDGNLSYKGKKYKVILDMDASENGIYEGNNTIESITFKNNVYAKDISRLVLGCLGVTCIDFAGLDMSELERANNVFYGAGNIQSFYLPKNMNEVGESITLPTSLTYSTDVWALASDENVSGTTLGIFKNNLSTKISHKAVNVLGLIEGQKLADLNFWHQAFDYLLDTTNNIITLKAYIGEDIDVYIPKIATIDGVNYTTYLGQKLFYEESVAQTISFETGVIATDLSYMFNNSTSITSVDLRGLDTSRVTTMYRMFGDGEGAISKLTSVNLHGIDTSNVTNMREMFAGCGKLEEIDMSGLDTSKVTNMSYMFACLDWETLEGLQAQGIDEYEIYAQNFSALKRINLTGFNTSSVTDMYLMFGYCTSLTNLDVSSFNTQNVTSMSYMFALCSGLKSINISNFNTQNVTTMSNMFAFCHSLESIDLSSLNISNLTSMSEMFSFCGKLETVNMSGLNASSLKDASGLFECYDLNLVIQLQKEGCSNEEIFSNENISSIKTINLTGFNAPVIERAQNMFFGCNKLESVDLSGFDLTNATDVTDMLGIGLSLCQIIMPKALPSDTDKIITLPATLHLKSDNYSTSGSTLQDFAAYLSTSLSPQELDRQFTLTIESNSSYGDVSQNSFTYYYGQAISVLANVITINGVDITATPETEEGYTISFDDWDGLQESYCKNSTIKANFTRVVNQYRITLKDGETTLDSFLVDYASELDIDDPIKTGYRFTGWDSEVPLTMPAENLTLNASFEINRYKLTFVLNNGQNNVVIEQDYNTSVTAPTSPQKIGHTFAGWDKDIPSTIPAGDMTINATWNVNKYTIKFVVEGQDYETIVEDYGTAITLPDNPTKTGYTFKGWGTNVPSTIPAENKTFNAVFAINQYTITYVLNNGQENIVDTYDYDTAITAPASPEKRGYTFTGWREEIPAKIGAENITVNANYEIVTYTISYDLDGGDVNGENPTTYTVESDNITFINPTKEGYTFVGWIENENDNPVKDYTIEKGSTGNKTLTAVWTTKSDNRMPIYVGSALAGVVLVSGSIAVGFAIAREAKRRREII